MGFLDNLQHVLYDEIYKNVSSDQISLLIILCILAIFVKLSGLHQLPEIVLKEYAKNRSNGPEFELFEELVGSDTEI